MADLQVLENDAMIRVVTTEGGQVAYDFDFLAYEAGHVWAVHTDASGVETELVAGVDFTVSGLEQENGGAIDITASGIITAVGDPVLIYRSVPIERLTAYSIELRAAVLNRELDTNTMILQELRRDVDRAAKSGLGEDGAIVDLEGALEGETLVIQADGSIGRGADQSDIGDAQENAEAAIEARLGAEAAEANSLIYRDRARDWATAAEDVAVDDGTNPSGFSAFHWAQKAIVAGRFIPNAVVALIADRDPFDGEAAGFSVLVEDDATNSNLPTVYFKLSAVAADWSGPVTFGSASASRLTLSFGTATDAAAQSFGDPPAYVEIKGRDNVDDGGGGLFMPWTAPLVAVGPLTKNKVTYSEELDRAEWTKTNAVVAAGAEFTAGGIELCRLTDDATNSFHTAIQSNTLVAGETYTFSIYAKAETLTKFRFGRTVAPDSAVANFDLGTGTVISTTAGVTAALEEVEAGIWRCEMTVTAAASWDDAPGSYGVRTLNAANANVYVGTGQSLLLGGIQIETAPAATSYQVNTTTGPQEAPDDADGPSVTVTVAGEPMIYTIAEQPISATLFGGREGADSLLGTGNVSAINNAIQFFIRRGRRNNVLDLGEGRFYYNDELELFKASDPRINVLLKGRGMHATQLFADFFGAEKTFLKNRDPANLERPSPISIADFEARAVTRVGGINPKLMEGFGWGNAYASNIQLGPCNNTQMTIASAQDIYISSFHSYFGGHSWIYKDTDGLLFDVTGAGTTRTITCTNGTPFTDGTAGQPNDVGKRFTTIPADGGTRIKWEIMTVGSTSVVTAKCTIGAANDVDCEGYFQHNVGTMAAGSNRVLVNVNTPCFDVGVHEGMILCVPRARSGVGGNAAILRGRIGSIGASGNEAFLVDEFGADLNADFAVSNSPFYTPTIDLYTPPGDNPFNAKATNNRLIGFNVNDYNGVAVSIIGIQQFSMTDFVFEGNIGSITSYGGPSGQMMLDDPRAVFQGDLGTHGGLGRDAVYICNLTRSVFFDKVEYRNFVGEEYTIYVEVSGGDGWVIVTGGSILNEASSILGQFRDANTTTKLILTGPLTMAGKSPEFHLGWGSYNGATGFKPPLIEAGNVGNGMIAWSSLTGNLVVRTLDGELKTIVTGGLP